MTEKFGVKPASIPDYLALMGDAADGYLGLHGWGAESAATGYLVSEDWKPFQKTQETGMCMSPTCRAFPKPSTTSWNWMFSSETLPPCEAISHSSRPSISCSGVGRPPTVRRWPVDWSSQVRQAH